MEAVEQRRRARILVVEDERHIARLLEHMLRKEGYEPSLAEDAEQALASMDANAPDAMLLDVQLPGMSGLDLLRKVRADARWTDLVVIVLSGQWFNYDDPAAIEAGATTQCPKPIAPSKLMRKLHECGVPPWLPLVHSPEPDAQEGQIA
jgi:two-component system phosphate regulon response regulator PhoB